MLNVQYMSDTHHEYYKNPQDHLPKDTDKDTVLALAGDIYNRKNLMPFLKRMGERYKYVVAVLGNHDYWTGSFEKVQRHHKAYIKFHNMDNVFLLFDEHVVIEDVVFYGGTMWTDFNNQDPLTRLRAPDFMVDYREIRRDDYQRRIDVNFVLGQHIKFLIGLKETLANPELLDKPVYVISHHAPSFQSVAQKYLHLTVDNGWYASDLSELILDHPQIKIWHHGHTHTSFDYMIGDTRVVCNPQGYPGEVISGRNPFKCLTIGD